MEFIKITGVEKTYPTGVTALYGLNLNIKKVSQKIHSDFLRHFFWG